MDMPDFDMNEVGLTLILWLVIALITWKLGTMKIRGMLWLGKIVIIVAMLPITYGIVHLMARK